MDAPDDPRPDDPTDEFDGKADEHDPVLEAAGARLRADAKPLSADAVQVAVLRRRTKRLTASLAAAVAVVVLGAGALALTNGNESTPSTDLATNVEPKTPDQRERVENLVASLAKTAPVDPRKVQLVSSVSTFGDCDSLIGDLRKVGAEHVGSQGFGAYGGGMYPYARFNTVGAPLSAQRASATAEDSAQVTPYGPNATNAGGETIGTNVQVSGVDELDSVKAAGKFIYDLDGKGNLRITDANTLEVRSTLDVTPKAIAASGGPGNSRSRPGPSSVSELLV